MFQTIGQRGHSGALIRTGSGHFLRSGCPAFWLECGKYRIGPTASKGYRQRLVLLSSFREFPSCKKRISWPSKGPTPRLVDCSIRLGRGYAGTRKPRAPRETPCGGWMICHRGRQCSTVGPCVMNWLGSTDQTGYFSLFRSGRFLVFGRRSRPPRGRESLRFRVGDYRRRPGCVWRRMSMRPSCWERPVI